MERLSYDYIDELVSDAIAEYESKDDLDVSFIAKYDDACRIIEEAVMSGLNISFIDIASENCNGYNREYIVTLSDGVWCEPMCRKAGYLDVESDVTYVLDNCSSAVLEHIDSERAFEVAIGFDDENENFDCSDCKNKDCMNNPHYSYLSVKINGKDVLDKDKANKIADVLNDVAFVKSFMFDPFFW